MYRMLIVLALFAGMHASAQEDPRIVPHVAQPRSLFDTWIYLTNDTPQPLKYTLTGYDKQGQRLEEVQDEVPALATAKFKSTALFDSPLVTHFLIDGEVQVWVSYQSPMYETVRAFVHETRLTGRRFRVFSSDWDEVFDGVVAVNLGDAPASVVFNHVNFQGEILEFRELSQEAEIPVMGKHQLVLGDPFGNGFVKVPESYIEIVSDQPLAIMVLSGDIPLRADAKLWVLEYQVLPVQEDLER